MTWNSWLISPLLTSIFFELGILLCFELIVKTIIDHVTNYDLADRYINIFSATYMLIIYLFMEFSATKLDYQIYFANFRLIILFTIILFMKNPLSRVAVGVIALSELFVADKLPEIIIEIIAIFMLIAILAYIKHEMPTESYLIRSILAIGCGLVFWGAMGALELMPWWRVFWHFLYFCILTLVLFTAIAALNRTNKLALLNSRYAKYDELTGVRNLRFFRDNFDKAITNARRSEIPLVLIALDIDHFKRINDTYGHLAGDAVLKQVTQRLTQTITDFDHNTTLYRVGGEEFNILVPNSDIYQGTKLAARCRVTILQTPISFGDKKIPVTLSLGVVDLNDDDTSLTLYSRADQNLYLSKGRGRNLVTANFKTIRENN